jgi:hypothetical protein
MKKIIELTVPESWSDITLDTYLKMVNEIKSYEGEEEAQTAVAIYHLCGLDAEQLSRISTESFLSLRNSLAEFMNNKKFELQQFVNIGGVEYGFEPNLSQISYGAFADITKYDTIEINENWAKIMSILYRPVEIKRKNWYSIKAYDGQIDEQKWLNVGMDTHFGALFFLLNLLKDLGSSILSSMKKEQELPPNIKSLLARSGEIMHQSLN